MKRKIDNLNIPEEFWSVFASKAMRDDCLEAMLILNEHHTNNKDMSLNDAKNYIRQEMPEGTD